MGEMPLPIVKHLRPGSPDFQDLPWGKPLEQWNDCCERLEEVQRGLSRHTVVFANYNGVLYAIKELPRGVASQEFDLLVNLEKLRLPAVIPVGHLVIQNQDRENSILITRFLDRSIPYRSLFMHDGLYRYREHLLDAIAGLLVQLHLGGVYWGDCSLSNTLFRRDAGTLEAYLVDAETAEAHPPRLEPTLRHHDLEIMEENINGEVMDLAAQGLLDFGEDLDFSPREAGTSIRLRYQSLWQEITRDQIISPDERYRIREKIQAMNRLGYSIGRVEIQSSEQGDKLRLRFMVSDRNFHRDQLLTLTGLEAEEMQARQMINEMLEVKASLSREHNRSTPLSVAAYYWMRNNYQPVMKVLEPLAARRQEGGELLSTSELYCQVLEHKWYLSEQAHHDVGHQAAAEDYLRATLEEKQD